MNKTHTDEDKVFEDMKQTLDAGKPKKSRWTRQSTHQADVVFYNATADALKALRTGGSSPGEPGRGSSTDGISRGLTIMDVQ
jgi:hypothetical protein